MFERFTDRARRVIVLGQEEARLLDHNYIGPEHLLLGLIQEGEGVASKALRELGISLEAVRQKVEEIIGRGQRAPVGHIPFTPQAKKVLELSLRESTQLGHNYIGTEHILLGLIREGDSVAAQVLVSLGAELNTVRQQVMRLLHGYRSPGVSTDALLRARGRGRLDDIGDQLGAIARRLTAIEARLGIEQEAEPEVLRQLDERIAEVARTKEAAIDAQDFKKAAALRDQEKQLLAERAAEEREWRATRPASAGTVGSGVGSAGTGGSAGGAEAGPGAGSVSPADPAGPASEADLLSNEVQRLTALLRQHGIDPAGDPPPEAEATP